MIKIYKIEKFSSPVHVSINTTAKCNLICTHCSGNYGPIKNNEMCWKEWEKVLDYLKYCKVYSVNLTGGEPTQFKYFSEFLTELEKANIYVTISTNLIFSDDILEVLIKNKRIIRNIKTSIDGYNYQVNGIIRKSAILSDKKLFETIISNYQKLKSLNFNITVTSVLHKELMKNWNNMVDFILKLQPNNWVVSPIVSVGRAEVNKVKIIPNFSALMEPDYSKVKAKLLQKGIQFSQVDFPSKEKIDPYGCPACNESIIINYDGFIAPCQLALEILPQYGYTFPNVKSTCFEEIWNCEAFERFRISQHQGCTDCSMNTTCKRCIPQSFKYFHDEFAPTPYCIAAAEILGLKRKNYWEEKMKIIETEQKDD